MGKVAKIDPGAVVLAGLTELNAGQVISDKVGVVGSNEKVPLIGFDGLTQQSTIDESHGAAAGMYASIPGRAPENLTGRGAEFADELDGSDRRRGAGAVRARRRRGDRGHAAGDRGGRRRPRRHAEAIYGLERTDGLVGDYEIDENGDPTPGADLDLHRRRQLRDRRRDRAAAGPRRSGRGRLAPSRRSAPSATPPSGHRPCRGRSRPTRRRSRCRRRPRVCRRRRASCSQVNSSPGGPLTSPSVSDMSAPSVEPAATAAR